MNKRSCCISSTQKRIMLDFLKERPLLVSGKFSSTFKYKDAENCWIELTILLNKVPGPHKEWKNWRKTWQDLRSRAKIKYRRIKFRAETKLPNEECLTQIEQEIINIIQENSSFEEDNNSNSDINLSQNSDLQEFIVISTVPEEHHHNNEIEVCEKCNSKISEKGINGSENNSEATFIITSNASEEEPHKIVNISGRHINFKDDRIEIINETTENVRNIHKSPLLNIFPRMNKVMKSRILRKKRLMKTDYHSKKLKLMEKLVSAKERSAAAKEQIAATLVNLLKKFNNNHNNL